jgi:hypothetical protein
MLMTVSPSASAEAAVLETANCVGTQKVTYSPGLLNDERPLNVSGRTTIGCVSTIPPLIRSGKMSYSVDVVRGCNTVPGEEFAGSKEIT